MRYLLLFLSSAIFGANCPLFPEDVIIFIDSCPTNEARYITDIGDGECSHPKHAENILRTYKHAGGKKKIWLFTAGRKHLYVHPYIIALKKALECNIKVISTSSATKSEKPSDFNQLESDLIRKFIKKGGRYYASAGNDGKNLLIYPRYPASYEGVYPVGAKDCQNENPESYPIAKYSNYGMNVEYYACGISPFDVYSIGTSYATPRIVADKEG